MEKQKRMKLMGDMLNRLIDMVGSVYDLDEKAFHWTKINNAVVRLELVYDRFKNS